VLVNDCPVAEEQHTKTEIQGSRMSVIINRYSFLLPLFIALCSGVLTTVHYYVNGQAIASAHLDGHYSIVMSYVVIAAILTIIFAIIKKTRKLKWFLTPIILYGISWGHRYISTLFDCCPGG
jgi:uncharacterized membrane protein